MNRDRTRLLKSSGVVAAAAAVAVLATACNSAPTAPGPGARTSAPSPTTGATTGATTGGTTGATTGTSGLSSGSTTTGNSNPHPGYPSDNGKG